MTQKTETILDRIVADKRAELLAAMGAEPLARQRRAAMEAPAVRPFGESLAGPGVGLIAEVKKASPSRGILRPDFNPVALARQYNDGGAAAISVLTDPKHFQGSLRHLRAVRDALPDGPPLLRKDFLFEEYQLYEARNHGADAVLLIAAILDDALLRQLIALTQTLGMDPLVEVHDEAELARAAAAGATIIGINNRDLRTFEVDLATTERIAPLAPSGCLIVAESGIFIRHHVRRLEKCGVDAVLIGEALVTAAEPSTKIREIMGVQ